MKRASHIILFILILCISIVQADELRLISRGQNYNLYENETKNIMKIYTSPVNYLEGDKYEPINKTITSENCEFDHCVRKGIYYADFKNNSKAKNLVKFYYNKTFLTYTPLSLKYQYQNKGEIISNTKNHSHN